MSLYSKFAEHYEQIFPFRNATLDFLQSYLPSHGRVLDIGCGSGHYAGRLADAGAQVVGIDLDPAMIRFAAAKYPNVSFDVMGMEQLSHLPGPFDAVFCIGNVLPHLPMKDISRFLSSLSGILRPGGLWLFQTVNFDPILTRSVHRFPDIFVNGTELVFYREYRPISAAGLTFCTRLEQAGQVVFNEQVDLYPLPTPEMIKRHTDAGFSLAGHWADFKRSQFLPEVDSGSVFLFRIQG